MGPKKVHSTLKQEGFPNDYYFSASHLKHITPLDNMFRNIKLCMGLYNSKYKEHRTKVACCYLSLVFFI